MRKKTAAHRWLTNWADGIRREEHRTLICGLGRYEPDWVNVKHETENVYLIRETKNTRGNERLRTSEALKFTVAGSILNLMY